MSSGSQSSKGEGLEVVIIEARSVDEMVGKIRTAAGAAGAAAAVAAWRAEHGDGLMRDRGHDFAVVNQSLMYLHDAPDGMLVPHARYANGTEKVYTDAAHAESAFA